MDLLTSGQAAAYLRIKKRKPYELEADGAIRCNVTAVGTVRLAP